MIVSLGGKPFLLNVARSHRAYGEALQITSPRGDDSAEDADAAVRRSLDTTHLAIREYVAHVAAMVHSGQPAVVTVPKGGPGPRFLRQMRAMR